MLGLSAKIFEGLRRSWVRQLGSERVQAIEDDLDAIVAAQTGDLKISDLPGWLR